MIAEKSFQRTDGETVQLYRVVPIYTDERELEIREGALALIRAFDRHDVPFIVDLDRPSVAR
jgi:predicted nucleic acid-binding protein